MPNFLFRGECVHLSVPTSPKLLKALHFQYEELYPGLQVTPLQIRVDLRRFKKEDDIIWQDCAEVDERDGSQRQYHASIRGEYLLPVLDFTTISTATILLPKHEPQHCFSVDLTRRCEFTFIGPEVDLPTKTLRNGELMRDASLESGGRIIYRLGECQLRGFAYL